MKPRRFGETLPLRIAADINRKLATIAASVGITKSDAARLAINIGLPTLESGRVQLPGLISISRGRRPSGLAGRSGAIAIAVALAALIWSAQAPGIKSVPDTMPSVVSSFE